MSSPLVLPVAAGQLPSGFCPPDYQSMLNGYAAALSVTFPLSFSGVVAQSTRPSDTTAVWLQLDTLGRPTRLYYFAQGAWLSMHTLQPGIIMIWPTALPDFTTFDGGDANALGPSSGPMWQQFTALNAAFPIGAGTLPSTTVVPVTGTGGEEKHQLTTTELASHSHVMPGFPGGGGTGGLTTYDTLPGAVTSYSTQLAGGDTPHNNLPPYFGVYFLQRTTRLFFAA
jgi:hypothetical protein